MHILFTNRDSTGAPVTKSLSVTLDGTRYDISVAKTGSANVPREVGEHLVQSDTYAVEAFDPHEDGEDDADDNDDSDDAPPDVAGSGDEPEPIIGQDATTPDDDDEEDDDDGGNSVLPNAISDRLGRGDENEHGRD